ncbi:hypothetical protein KFK09_007765 [Dendrobium nobile]|uniref:PGG domain-containing protein n=1 Tax=Dendrobium nobile TaxID=94219 RepID=A0A8T3BXS1_DENNO|nr:hypothetical protein KFK09_007765 [Dendrobium nobile]
MGDPNASLDITPIPSFCRKESFRRTYQAIDNAIRRNDELYLRRHLEELAQKKAETLRSLQKLEEQYYAVNLSGDPLLSVLISYEKTEMAQKLLKYMDEDNLLEANLQGNTALHVAAAVGDKVMEIAEKLIAMNKSLLNTGNENNETPLLRAALYGQQNMFWMLYDRSDDNAIIDFKRMDGANVLHCAIMGNAPRLALDIAERFPHLRTRRNTAAVTPLQLMVTIPGAFKSEMEFGLLETIIYKCIPLYDDGDKRERDASFAIKDDYGPGPPIPEIQHDEENPQLQRTKSFPPNYATMFNLLKWTKIPAGWAILHIFRILKLFFPRIKYLEQQKRNHKETMALIVCLAGDFEYWDFIGKGKTGQSRSFSADKPPIVDDRPPIVDESRSFSADESPIVDDKPPIVDAALQRWNDSPLITGAKLGLHEFVDKILEVYPQSVNILDVQGNNVIQVAILLGSKKIFELVASKLTGRNPVLPSRLLYARDNKSNTILHYAAEVTVDEEVAGGLQMQKDLQWFEKVKKLMPRDLQYSRNAVEMTAQECFSKNHKNMARKGKEQLTQLGQTCASLVAAFVFASSFSIPGSDDSGGGGNIYGKAAFIVFKNAFVFGLSCAATALVLFLSLVISSYRESEFRRSIPTKFFFAVLSFVLALISLLVAFACNIFLQIYSGRRIGAKALIPFVCELTVFPAFVWFLLLYRGCSFGIISLFKQPFKFGISWDYIFLYEDGHWKKIQHGIRAGLEPHGFFFPEVFVAFFVMVNPSQSSTSSKTSSPIKIGDVPIQPQLKFLMTNVKSVLNIQFTAENYTLWKTQILKLFTANGFEGFLDGSASKPPKPITSANVLKPNPEYYSWLLIDQNLAAVLYSTISTTFLPYVLSDSCCQIWQTIERRLQSTNHLRILQLKNELHHVSMKDKTMMQYLSEIKGKVDAIGASGSPLSSDDIIMYTLNGLPSAYQGFKIAIRTNLNPISLDDFYALLCSEELNIAAESARPIARSSWDDQTKIHRPGLFPGLFSGRYFEQYRLAWTMSPSARSIPTGKLPGANLGKFWSKSSTDRPRTIPDRPGRSWSKNNTSQSPQLRKNVVLDIIQSKLSQNKYGYDCHMLDSFSQVASRVVRCFHWTLTIGIYLLLNLRTSYAKINSGSSLYDRFS